MWPYGRLWGDREERKAVRSYLKKVWEDNNDTHRVEDTLENVRREKDQILYVSLYTHASKQIFTSLLAVVVECSLWTIRYG